MIKKYSDMDYKDKVKFLEKWERDDEGGELSGDEILPQIQERLLILNDRINDHIKGHSEKNEFFSEPPAIWDLNDIYKYLRETLNLLKSGKLK